MPRDSAVEVQAAALLVHGHTRGDIQLADGPLPEGIRIKITELLSW
jgi:hypothetical protein